MDARAAAERLKGWALEEGFDGAGVATLEPHERGPAFVAWLARGDQAGMGYLERRLEARLNPATVLAGARSVLCVALQYHPLATAPDPAAAGAASRDGAPDITVRDAAASPGGAPDIASPEPRAPGAAVLDGAALEAAVQAAAANAAGGAGHEAVGDLWPRVARYARGRDYHEVMGECLRRLAARIEDGFPGVVSRSYVDTGPVLERELAARAGLGAVGKNTNLLNRRDGSWFLLGELFLTLDLAPDAPLADLCGSCTRCLTACPTGALPEPFRLDSRRCISYWTIEHRGALPAAAREMVGDWVFGCDICQEACPWNGQPQLARRGATADHPELRLPPERGELDLAALLLLDRDGYVARFRGSPMKRARREGLQRNAAVAMGNRQDPRYVAPLARALASGEPLVRAHAAWALGRIGGAAAERALTAAAASETDPDVRGEIADALAALGGAAL